LIGIIKVSLKSGALGGKFRPRMSIALSLEDAQRGYVGPEATPFEERMAMRVE